MSGAEVLFSAAEGAFDDAVYELTGAVPGVDVRRLGPDVGLVAGAGSGEIASVVRSRPAVFVRHLAVRVAVVRSGGGAGRVVAAAVDALGRRHDAVALQVWASGEGQPKAEAVRAEMVTGLAAAGITTTRAGAPTVLGVCLAGGQAHVCVTPADDALCDWPGGRVRLARSPDLVSRAELKLDELLLLHPLDLSGGVALDLGASPGGWTRVLRLRGIEVWAVDPAELDPAVGADPLVHHVRATAGSFLGDTDMTFDVVVNDMRMDAKRSTDTVVAASRRLRRGGVVVTTLKLPARHRVSLVRDCLRSLTRELDVEFARQLFHNRDEVTVVARRASHR